MAITINRTQISKLAEALNADYASNKKEKSNLKVKDLPEEQQKPPLEKLFEKEAGNKEFLDRVAKLRELEGPEIADQVLRSYINFGKNGWNEEDDKAPTKDAFYSVPAPKDAEMYVYCSDYELEKYGMKQSSEDILGAMTAEERAWFFKKLNFPAFWRKELKKGDIKLRATVPAQKKVFNATFRMEPFMKQAAQIIQRPEKEATVDHEKLVEDLIELLDAKCKEEYDQANDEENMLSGDEGSYAAEDAQGRDYKEIYNEMDDSIQVYMDKLSAKGVDEDDIVRMLCETGEEELGDHHTPSNYLGRSHLSSENELYLDNADEWVTESTWPYPGDFDANLSILDDEDIKKIEKGVGEGSARFKYNEAMHQYVLDNVTVYLGDDRSIDLVADEKAFIMDASRKLKDLMLHPRRKLKKTASLERYPALARLLDGLLDEEMPATARVLAQAD